MKKKLLVLTILLCAMLFSSCTMVPASRLEAMFRTDRDTAVTTASGAAASGSVQSGGDTVTISREEYEKYRQFSEMFEIYDDALEIFYQDPDTEKMVGGMSFPVSSGDPIAGHFQAEKHYPSDQR